MVQFAILNFKVNWEFPVGFEIGARCRMEKKQCSIFGIGFEIGYMVSYNCKS